MQQRAKKPFPSPLGTFPGDSSLAGSASFNLSARQNPTKHLTSRKGLVRLGCSGLPGTGQTARGCWQVRGSGMFIARGAQLGVCELGHRQSGNAIGLHVMSGARSASLCTTEENGSDPALEDRTAETAAEAGAPASPGCSPTATAGRVPGKAADPGWSTIAAAAFLEAAAFQTI
ncbi:programmed cell death protein 5 [Platysternon megacephalum]|uniref:Programmed cell death protein 5 n=1 Tax=Platysternon megacephalum TaxID=55544 RepID=A0A4D9F2W7_9SAUR|nr:programmed cell death protein 5 [Platysternon megacephalum]